MRRVVIIVLVFLMSMGALMMFSSSAPHAKGAFAVPRFGDMYECYIIIDAEVSPYSIYRTPERSDLISEIVEVEEDYEQVDYEELMSILARGRYVHAGFLPAWRLQLYDDDGVRYRIYVSKSCRFFRIDGNYFKLSYRQAQRLRALFGQS